MTKINSSESNSFISGRTKSLKVKIRKGDLVLILLGKDRGRKGKVLKVMPRKNMVVVEGLNLYKKHVKPKGKNQPGGIVEKERPLFVSKVALVCPRCNQKTRVGYQIDSSKDKYRICKKCKAVIDNVVKESKR